MKKSCFKCGEFFTRNDHLFCPNCGVRVRTDFKRTFEADKRKEAVKSLRFSAKER